VSRLLEFTAIKRYSIVRVSRPAEIAMRSTSACFRRHRSVSTGNDLLGRLCRSMRRILSNWHGRTFIRPADRRKTSLRRSQSVYLQPWLNESERSPQCRLVPATASHDYAIRALPYGANISLHADHTCQPLFTAHHAARQEKRPFRIS
jgi:hypothetical protein